MCLSHVTNGVDEGQTPARNQTVNSGNNSTRQLEKAEVLSDEQ